MTTESLAELLYRAYGARLGVVVQPTPDAERLRQKLYGIIRDNPDLKGLALIISPLNGADLWIVKKEVPVGTES